MTALECTIPGLHTQSANDMLRGNRFGHIRKAKQQRHAVQWSLIADDHHADEPHSFHGCLAYQVGAPVTVTITRCSAGELDSHDNLRTALKHVVDGVADFLGCHDNDERITYVYAQEKTKRGTHAVKIKIERTETM
jgi:hypothetical protein